MGKYKKLIFLNYLELVFLENRNPDLSPTQYGNSYAMPCFATPRFLRRFTRVGFAMARF